MESKLVLTAKFSSGPRSTWRVADPRCDHSIHLSDPATAATTDQWEPFSDALDTWWRFKIHRI